MDTLIKIGQLLLSLSILIVLHELGHFLFARLFKTRVEKFYLFFDPWFSLFKIKKGETEYGIGWLPLGGYVKISGMIDESMDKEQMKQPEQPYEFRSKKAWQRLLIMLGGVIVNFILGFVIYTFILFNWGETYLPNENMIGGIQVGDSVMTEAVGLQTGDKIVSINGEAPERFSQIIRRMFKGGEMVVERDGELVNLEIPYNFAGILSTNRIKSKKSLITPRIPFVIASFSDSSLNKNSGLMPEDRIIGLNGKTMLYFDQYPAVLDTSKGKSLTCQALRKGDTLNFDLQIDKNGLIGVALAGISDLQRLGYLELVTKKYSFFQSIPAGYNYAKTQLLDYIDDFKLILDFKSGAHKGMGGFAAIGSLFPPTWDWQSFWEITALLSLMLAFLNVLPIPLLDGGHVMFVLYEMITGRKPSDKFMEYAQYVGMVLLLFLLLYANGNDVYRWIAGMKGN
ncbi:MAG: RIP metalloprotease RseP [Bacteroidales bacterium]|nr:RIP metalloprotease RseP [Bacteroidales bacterium]MBN2817573.1 RIP metalloprotease RseP [Bacteroidales bacterium]